MTGPNGGASGVATSADLSVTFPDAKTAAEAAAALAPDDDGFLTTRVAGSVLHLHAEADSIMGALRSLDDALGCLRAVAPDL